MRKDQFIELIRGALTSADPNPDLKDKYHKRRINFVLSEWFKSAIYDVFRNRMDEIDLYTRPYTVDILFDSATKEYYSILPVPVMQLPRMGGIRKISPVSENWSFDPIPETALDVFEELEVSSSEENPSFLIRNDRVVYQFTDWKQAKLKEALMRIVLPFESYADSDEVYIPAGKEEEITDFAFQMLARQLPTDNSQNLNDDQS